MKSWSFENVANVGAAILYIEKGHSEKMQNFRYPLLSA